jgi:hypothetical protein
MERKFFTLIILFVFCFLFSCSGGSGGDLYSGDSDSAIEWAVAVDDLDLDGAVDIALTFTDTDGNPDHYASVILNDLNFPGSFFLSDEFELKGSKRDWPTSITLGDLNDDGFPDIATENGEAIFILFQDSTLPGQFFVPLKIAVDQVTESLAIGDLNEDGFNDLAISGGGPHLSILFQDSLNPGIFLPLVNLGISSSSVAIGDLDGDFINDMAVTSSGKVKLLFQDPVVPGSFSVAMNLDVGDQPTDVKIEDLDKDGRLDLVVGNFGPPDDFKKGSVSVLLQDAINAGQFLPAVNYSFKCRAREISLGDLNDNGFLDIAIASGCEDCEITILFQDITNIGTFLSPVKYSCKAFPYPWSIAIGDMNNDNFNDLIISEDGFVIRFQDSASPGNFLGRTKIYDPN